MEPDARKPRSRGVYVIPTSLTVFNIFFGFTAMLLSVRGMQATALGDMATAAHLFQRAAWALFIAAVFDTFDGLVARAMHATSEFGKEYDSIADVVTFGAAPAILVYCWGLNVYGRLGGGIAFLFLVAGSLRLARFNIQHGKSDHRYFVGLPIPAGALTLASIINFAPAPIVDRRFGAIMLAVTAALAFAMVSTIRYRSQKHANLQKQRPFGFLLILAVLLVVMYRWPEEFFFIASISYVLSGPVMKLWGIAFPSRSVPPAEPQDPLEPTDGEVTSHPPA